MILHNGSQAESVFNSEILSEKALFYRHHVVQ